MASETDDADLKAKLLGQAAAYRKLAEKRAEQMGVSAAHAITRNGLRKPEPHLK